MDDQSTKTASVLLRQIEKSAIKFTNAEQLRSLAEAYSLVRSAMPVRSAYESAEPDVS